MAAVIFRRRVFKRRCDDACGNALGYCMVDRDFYELVAAAEIYLFFGIPVCKERD